MSELHRISGQENGAAKADVLFIHGLGGDALKTWRHGKDESTSWPHWVANEFPHVAVWSLDPMTHCRTRVVDHAKGGALRHPVDLAPPDHVCQGGTCA